MPNPALPVPGLTVRPTHDRRGRRRARTVAVSLMLALVGITLPPVTAVAADEPAPVVVTTPAAPEDATTPAAGDDAAATEGSEGTEGAAPSEDLPADDDATDTEGTEGTAADGTADTTGTDEAPAPQRRDVGALAVDDSDVAITKTNDVDGPLTPGTEFVYEITAQCSGLTVDCVNATVTDVLPEGLEWTSLPTSSSTYEVDFDPATRTLVITFVAPLQEPAGEKGLGAGTAVNLEIGMRLPADTPVLDGTVISNSATIVADNALTQEDTSDLTVSVPRVVRPVATKSWAGPANIAGNKTTSTITLGVRNSSSSSTSITELSITDSTPATFEHFDLTSATLVALPAGATNAQLFVTVGGLEVPAGSLSAPGAFTLPDGVDAADVTGVRVAFDAAGAPLPYDATGGTVELGMVLRDTLRSTDEPLKPASRLNVENCAVPGAVDDVDGTPVAAEGTPACAPTRILPDTVVVGADKAYFADTNGDFVRSDLEEFAVFGKSSPVSAIVTATNLSPFEIGTLTIQDPHPGLASDRFDLLDVTTVRVELPQGATSAVLVVTYDDGSEVEKTFSADGDRPVAVDGLRVAGVTVTFTGVDADGAATIAENAAGRLKLHGTLNDLVTRENLPDGLTRNCAAVTSPAIAADATGAGAAEACADLVVEDPDPVLNGVKTVGQTSVPLGQPIPFALQAANNGNVVLVNPSIVDPATDADGVPVSGAANPFTALRLTGATVDRSPGTPAVALEVYDPDAAQWVAYAGASAELLERVTGVRARMLGELTQNRSFTLHLTTERRDDTVDGVEITNCYTPTADGYVGTAACSPNIRTEPAAAGGSINKLIDPGTLPRWVPGLAQQTAVVQLTAKNSGNMSMSMLELTDADADFFDAMDLVGFPTNGLTMPAGADRAQVDALVDGTWVTGVPRGSRTAVLPAGVTASTVTGLRITFTSTSDVNDGYTLTPCAPTADCGGTVRFTVSPRQHPRSDAAGEIPTEHANTVSARYRTLLNTVDGDPSDVPPVSATLDLVEGTSQLAVSKTPSSSIRPGETAPFRLTVTNTGQSNIADLVVKDLLPVGLELDETFVGDGGQPFKVVSTVVPDGTPPVPSPVFTTTLDGERTAGLEWDFSTGADGQPWLLAPSARLTVEIQVRLEPGVVTGQVVTNTMGATGTAPSFQCAGTSQTDGAFGEGTYCTASAGVTVVGGASFSARKWVAGTVDLGWYNTRTRTNVEVGGPQCPSRVGPDSVLYTAFPCIALVNPGDDFQYLLRLVNAGTESTTNMRVVDRFPVEGDTGVTINRQRGTQWTTRPALATEPVLSGPGVMTTRYTNASTICTADLAMGGAGSNAARCAPGDWDAPFSRDVTAASMDVVFPTPLVPGAAVDITFSMSSPVDATEVATPTVAWNSFAHAETTLRGGNPNVLPATEPIQVGVGLMFGQIEITKEIGENPYDLPLDAVSFDVQVQCTIDPVGGDVRTVRDEVYSVSVDSPLTVSGIPSGAECRVWELDAHGASGDATETDPVVVTIPADASGVASSTTVTITNDFSTTSLALVKDVVGRAGLHAQTTYPASVTCTYDGAVVTGFPQAVTISSVEQTLVDVPSGAECSVVETNPGGASKVTYGAGTDVSEPTPTVAGETATLQVVNEFRAGSLVVAKDFTGPGAEGLTYGPFVFSVVCSLDGRADAVTTEIVVEGDGAGTTLYSEPLEGLPVGAECVVSETGTGGADTTPAPVTVTIPDVVDDVEQTVVAGFTNVFSAATLDLTKLVDGDAAESEAVLGSVFTVLVTCQVEATDGTRLTLLGASAEIMGGETLRLVDADGSDVLLPNGTRCFAAETETGGATAVTIEADSYETAVVVGASDEVQEIGLTVVNTFTTPPPPVDPGTVDPTDPATPGEPGEPAEAGTDPSTDGAVPPADAEAGSGSGGLPVTGADVVWVSALALLLLGAGAVLVVRRRQTAETDGAHRG
ncbi:DUF5979 domain-containing protein [Sanguibacter keddieii]|uniref:DUF5979 domain-containing protein n=1 Tax=Sanguibacter keddieii TaxID=60920 RepID=UPI0001B84193|nr:DUF5979 domain-containing protein [Sanguibacter keddieii]